MDAKWGDTIIETPDHSESVYCPHCGEEQGIERMVAIIREAQAEITWPIAFEAGLEQGKAERGREVVEFIDWLDNGTRSSASWRSEMRKFRRVFNGC